MKHIVSLALMENAKSGHQFDRQIEIFGETMRVTQFCTELDFDLTKSLIKKFDGVADIICLSGFPPKVSYKGDEFIHPQVQELKKTIKNSPFVDGQILKEVYLPWAIRQYELRNENIISRKKVGLYSGAVSKNVIEVLEELNCSTYCADPYYFLKLPFNIKSNQELENFISFSTPLLKRMKIKKGISSNFKISNKKIKIGPFYIKNYQQNLKEFFDCDVFIGNFNILQSIDLQHLKDKTLIVDIMNQEFLEKLKQSGVHQVLVGLPSFVPGLPGHFSLFEAILALKYGAEVPLRSNDVLSFVDELHLKPELYVLNEITPQKRVFAFIVHPLSSSQFFRHPQLKWLRPFHKKVVAPIENAMSLASGFYWGNIKGIQSEFNQAEVEGHIYMLPYTPKKLMSSDPASVYKKLIGLCLKAKLKGAKIVGLGAYTKIVGDAGITVARNSPIPVTTGNSLSAAATLWAAKLAILKMDMVQEQEGIVKGRVMVIGATGSIGAVSAKILAQTWSEIVIVAPRAHRLLELKDEILKINPKASVFLSTDPGMYLGSCHLVITTTSGKGDRILNIEDVRPGAVICDVARPFDISREDTFKRPDVLVIASGEVELPGPLKMNVDLALEGNVVYACLAETALLALEGRFESFTLSRNIHYQKVLEIDQMAKKHGVKLSKIMGHSGPISDQEFVLCREHAFNKLKNWDEKKKSKMPSEEKTTKKKNSKNKKVSHNLCQL